MSKIIFTIDVEPDLHTGRYFGVTQGLKRAEEIFSKKGIKPILFITCDCLEKHKKLFQKLNKKGWEISLHGFSHIRFDSLFLQEKEEQIKRAVSCFQKNLKIKPKGFRAPQHSIDNPTLDLLEKYNFQYDSSYTPLNFLQLLFFPTKLKLWIRHFFSPRKPYKIKENLIERAPSSFFLPFTSLTIRVLPMPCLEIYIWLLKKIYKQPIFYCHSWDFIRLKGSKVDRIFPTKVFQRKLSKILK